MAFSNPRIGANSGRYVNRHLVLHSRFAISEQEYGKDINAVAAPILDADGCPVAAIAIAGPSYRLSQERMLMLGQSIRAATEAIAHEMGLATLSVFVSHTVAAGNAG